MKRSWTTEELIDLFTITPKDFEFINLKKNEINQLGFACIYKFFQLETRFPSKGKDVPVDIVRFIAKQLRIKIDNYWKYDFAGRTFQRHCADIREIFGFKEMSAEDADQLGDWLSQNIGCSDKDRGAMLFYEKLREKKLEPPTTERTERIIASAIKTYENTLFCSIKNSLPKESLLLIDDLLKELSFYEDNEELKDTITFNMLRSDPGRICLESVFNEINKLQTIRKLKLPDNLFSNIPPKVLKGYKQRVSSELLGEIRRHPDEIRYSLLSAFFWLRSREITDNLVELLIAIIHKIDAKAVKRVEQETLNDLKKVSGKNSILRDIAELSVENPDGIIKDVIYPLYSKELLADLVKDLKMKNTFFKKKVYILMKNSYSKHYRRMLPKLLDILMFKSNNDTHRPVINAIGLIKQIVESPVKFIAIDENTPISGIIKDKWKSAVIQKDESGREVIEKINYEICVLQALREKLRCKEIWVDGADKYRNPEEDLPDNFDINRKEYYEALKQPSDVEDFIAKLQKEMAGSLLQLNKTVLKNPKVRISNHKGGQITITPFEAQKEPKNLSALKNELAKRWPMINLLDILKETDFYTDLTSQFKSSGVRESMDRETIKRRLLMALFSLGTNTGLKRIAKASNDPESFDELRYVKRKFINKDSLRNAIVSVVNNILEVRTNSIWGEGTSCASDSKKFGAWDQNLMTEWHIRYRGRGVMIYWHVEKKSTCIYSQLKNCSSSEVAAMIEGVLKHCTDMTVNKNYVDTHGQSEVAFAFSHLLNFSLMPRFKNINRQKLYVPDNEIKDELTNLTPVVTRSINWDIIREQYDQMIKYTTALRIGTAETEAIMKRFTKSNLQHPTYAALQELGKVVKTIFLCEYLMSENLRIEINEGLNVVENWNSANSFIFYGKSGEIQTNNLEDQELSVLSLHLLQNCLIYINTLMIQEVLSQNEWMEKMQPEDLRALTPLIYQHVNPYGIFNLDMSVRIPIKTVV